MHLQLDCSSNMNTRKINSRTNQNDYGNFETTVGKLSARRIQISWANFCLVHFDLFFQNNFSNDARTKLPKRIGFASSNTLVLRTQVFLRSLGLFGN